MSAPEGSGTLGATRALRNVAKVLGHKVPDMKSPFECPRYAQECRVLANGYDRDRRREVLRMADIWESPARDGEQRQPEQVSRADRIGVGLDPRIVRVKAIRARFAEVASQPLPKRFRDLLKRLDKVA